MVRILAQREAAFNVRLLTKTAVDLGLKGVTAETVERRVAALLEKGALDMIVDRRHAREQMAAILAKFMDRPQPA